MYIITLNNLIYKRFNIIEIENIQSVCSIDNATIKIQTRVRMNDNDYFSYNVKEKCANDVVRQLFDIMLFNKVKNLNGETSPLNKISNTLEKFVENVGVSIGSDEYNQAKSHFENNIK